MYDMMSHALVCCKYSGIPSNTSTHSRRQREEAVLIIIVLNCFAYYYDNKHVCMVFYYL